MGIREREAKTIAERKKHLVSILADVAIVAEAGAVLCIIDCLIFFREHRLNARRFKSFPAQRWRLILITVIGHRQGGLPADVALMLPSSPSTNVFGRQWLRIQALQLPPAAAQSSVNVGCNTSHDKSSER